MKNIFQYITVVMFALMAFSCGEDNENWRIVTDVQPGIYVSGSATIYSAVASTSALSKVDFDNGGDGNVVGLYTWLKSDGDFTILRVDGEGNQVNYGQGAEADGNVCSLVADATPFKVSKDGLYFVIVNADANTARVMPVEMGIIGDATAGGWSDETSMGAATYDEAKATVNFVMEGASLDKKSMKFRFGGDWGIDFPYDGASLRIHTNHGGASAGNLSEAFSECKGGGENFSVSQKGTYTITLSYSLKSKKFQAKGVCTSVDDSSVELPTAMYIIGSPYKWVWANSEEMIPVNGVDGCFWAIQYFEKDAELKFNHVMDWNGDEFGASTADAIGFGDYEAGGENMKIAESAYYQVIVKAELSADKKSIVYSVSLKEPQVYMMGDASPAEWNVDDKNKFSIEGDEFVSPAAVKDGNLRMFVDVIGDAGSNWWKSEFNIFEGKIVCRGNGGDQAPVAIAKGQKAYLNFKTKEGVIK